MLLLKTIYLLIFKLFEFLFIEKNLKKEKEIKVEIFTKQEIYCFYYVNYFLPYKKQLKKHTYAFGWVK